jgi:sugar (pentulose or hexulose) kinase
MDYVIGVDIGTQSTKALLCGACGRIVATPSQAIDLRVRSVCSKRR